MGVGRVTKTTRLENTKATLKKKFVSCPAGGRNYGHSGGRKFFFFFLFLFFFGKKITKILQKKNKKIEN